MPNLITMSRLGRMGRWGNQIFQYAFLQTYTLRYGLDYQCSPWIGQVFCGHNDPPITDVLPIYHEYRRETKYGDILGETMPPNGDEVCGCDFVGYAQFHMTYYWPYRDFIRMLFKLTPTILERLEPALKDLQSRGKTIVALHMRRATRAEKFTT